KDFSERAKFDVETVRHFRLDERIIGHNAQIETLKQCTDTLSDKSEGNQSDGAAIIAWKGWTRHIFLLALDSQGAVPAPFQAKQNLRQGVFGHRHGIRGSSRRDGDVLLPEFRGHNRVNGSASIEHNLQVRSRL